MLYIKHKHNMHEHNFIGKRNAQIEKNNVTGTLVSIIHIHNSGTNKLAEIKEILDKSTNDNGIEENLSLKKETVSTIYRIFKLLNNHDIADDTEKEKFYIYKLWDIISPSNKEYMLNELEPIEIYNLFTYLYNSESATIIQEAWGMIDSKSKENILNELDAEHIRDIFLCLYNSESASIIQEAWGMIMGQRNFLNSLDAEQIRDIFLCLYNLESASIIQEAWGMIKNQNQKRALNALNGLDILNLLTYLYNPNDEDLSFALIKEAFNLLKNYKKKNVLSELNIKINDILVNIKSLEGLIKIEKLKIIEKLKDVNDSQKRMDEEAPNVNDSGGRIEDSLESDSGGAL